MYQAFSTCVSHKLEHTFGTVSYSSGHVIHPVPKTKLNILISYQVLTICKSNQISFQYKTPNFNEDGASVKQSSATKPICSVGYWQNCYKNTFLIYRKII